MHQARFYMANKWQILAAASALCLMACTSSGPQKTLEDVATALNNYDSASFLNAIDMPKFTANYITSMTENDSALSSLNALGSMLGLGNLDELIGSVMDMRGKLTQEFDQGVSSGELVIQCKRSEHPDCPWVPQSLKSATIVQINDNAAIAKVTTPAKLTSWLALSKIDNKWQIVGQAVLEKRAREYALSGAGMASAQQTEQPATNI